MTLLRKLDRNVQFSTKAVPIYKVRFRGNKLPFFTENI